METELLAVHEVHGITAAQNYVLYRYAYTCSERRVHLYEVDVCGVAAAHGAPAQPCGQTALQLIDNLCPPCHEPRSLVLAHL